MYQKRLPPFIDQHGNRYQNVQEAAKKIGCNSQSICSVLRGERPSVFGYKFTPLDEPFAFKSKGHRIEYGREYRKKRSVKDPLWNFKRHIFERYRMRYENFLALYNNQGCVCPGCKTSLDLNVPRSYAIDHDHNTGGVRGILCGPCNRRLGFLETKHEINASLLEYVNQATLSTVQLPWGQFRVPNDQDTTSEPLQKAPQHPVLGVPTDRSAPYALRTLP